MKFIPSTKIKSKGKKTIVADYKGLRFDLENSGDSCEVFVNGKELGSAYIDNEIFTFKTEGPEGEIKVDIWVRASIKNLVYSLSIEKGAGMRIDDIPVQNTLADPLFVIKKSRLYIVIFIAFLFIKSIFPIFQYLNNNLNIFGLIGQEGIYFIPFMYLLITTLSFKSMPKTAVYSGLIIGILETLDYGVGGILNLNINLVFIVFFLLRIGCIIALINAAKQFNKI